MYRWLEANVPSIGLRLGGAAAVEPYIILQKVHIGKLLL